MVSIAQNRAIDSLRQVLSSPLSEEEQMLTYNRLGSAFYRTQIYQDSAFYYTEKAYNIAVEKGLLVDQARALFGMAGIHTALKRYESAIDYYEKALIIIQEVGSQFQLSSTYNNIGAVNFQMGSYREAIFNYNKALYMSLESGDSRQIAVDYMNIGEAEYELGRLDASKEHFELSKKHLESLKWEPSTFFLFYAKTLFALGQTLEAKASSEKSLTISKKENDLFMIAENSKLLSEIEDKLKKHTSAFDHYKTYIKYSDSLDTARERNEIEKLKLNFELDRADEDLAFASKKSKYTYIIYCLIGIGLLLLVFLVAKQRRIIKMTQQARDVQTQLIGQKLGTRTSMEEDAIADKVNLES